MAVFLSPAAMAQAAEDVEAMRQQNSPDLLNRMSPLEAQALASNGGARQIANAMNNEIGPFGKPIPAEVLRRSDTLFSWLSIPADATAIPNIVPFFTVGTPDGIGQSTEVVNQRITSQVNFEVRSLSLQLELGLGNENWDYLQRSFVFNIDSVDQNIFRRNSAGGLIRDQATFATALSGFAAPGLEVTLITGKDARGVDFDPTQYILWAADQTLNYYMRFVAGAALPVSLGVGAVTYIGLVLWGRKQTLLKA